MELCTGWGAGQGAGGCRGGGSGGREEAAGKWDAGAGGAAASSPTGSARPWPGSCAAATGAAAWAGEWLGLYV